MHSVPRPRPSLSGRLGLALIATTALLAGTFLAALAPSAQAIGFEKVFAGNCKIERCGIKSNGEGGELSEPSRAEDETNGFRVPGGYTPFGVTAFRMETEKLPEEFSTFGEQEAPVGFLTGGSARNIRTDVAPGVVTNPFAPGLGQCPTATFERHRNRTGKPGHPGTRPLRLSTGRRAVTATSKPPRSAASGRAPWSNSPKARSSSSRSTSKASPTTSNRLTGFGATYGVEVYTGSNWNSRSRRSRRRSTRSTRIRSSKATSNGRATTTTTSKSTTSRRA